MPRTEIKSEIVKTIGTLASNKTGWNREVNIVKWNDGKAKLDIRDWGPNHERVGKGISLSSEEVAVLKELLADYDPYECEE
ncbi:MAG: PC4/YdbC family ssDNA-binding protein [Clostridia bacterium]|nr:PC4/YdbC family ssDNA-binding protein [Clostridia bacterium]